MNRHLMCDIHPGIIFLPYYMFVRGDDMIDNQIGCCCAVNERRNSLYLTGDKGGDLADDLIRCGLLNKVAKYKLYTTEFPSCLQ